MRSFVETPLLTTFADVTRSASHAPVPSDWLILVCDVKGSTQAVAAGRYQDVNLIGASSIIAVLNASSADHVAFVFGGDGATFIISPEGRDRALQALLATRAMARASFQLDLRVGIVPVAAVRAAGHDVRAARFQLSSTQTQSVLSGEGIRCAEEWIKRPAPNPYLLNDDIGLAHGSGANFVGLECRWQPLRSRRGEIITILVYSASEEIYADVIAKTQQLFGTSEELSPVNETNLKLTKSLKKLFREALVVKAERGLVAKWWYATWHLLQTTLFRALRRGRVAFAARYQREVVENSDFRKFDGTLRMVLDGTREQRELYVAYLERLFQQNQLVYGVHVSDAALMTCLIFERFKGHHLHLVDGSQGGYTEAARALKLRVKQKEPGL